MFMATYDHVTDIQSFGFPDFSAVLLAHGGSRPWTITAADAVTAAGPISSGEPACRSQTADRIN